MTGSGDFKSIIFSKFRIFAVLTGHIRKDIDMTMRKCIRCGWKDESGFNLRDTKRGLLQYVCRDCQRAQAKERYENNKENVLQINRQATQKSQIRATTFIQTYLADKSCVDCGETDLEVLTFDHVRGEKKYSISNMITRGYNIETIQKELEKTEVVCFNCHMRREQK
jgi:hypothetical protein